MFAGLDLSPGSSALVILDGGGRVLLRKHFSEEKVKWSLQARLNMARNVYETLIYLGAPDLVGLEDYELSIGQHVSYQIAEVGGIIKYLLLSNSINLILIHPRKRQSYVARRRDVTKNDCIEWAEQNGFDLPAKKPGQPGLYKRQREDLADAFICAHMARQADMHLGEGSPPKRGDIFLDPKTGILLREDLCFQHFDPRRTHVKTH